MRINLLTIIVLFTVAFTSSCTNDIMYTDNNQIEHVSDSNFVHINEALLIASKQKMLTTRGVNELNDYLEIKQDSEIPQLYIINFIEGGFIIISADKRIEPILAYSESSNFPLDDFSNMPYGLSFWLNTTCNFIDSVRYENIEQDMRTIASWQEANNPSVNYLPDNAKGIRSTNGEYIYTKGDSNWDHDDCRMEGELLVSYYYYVPPLLQTQWDQGEGYNEACPIIFCPSSRRADVGCAAISTGQIMNYHLFPLTYQWTVIGEKGQLGTQNFLRDIGKPGNLNIQYDCAGSSAQISDVTSFLTREGYSWQQSVNFSSGTIQWDVAASRPVILAGGHKAPDGSLINGHMWVCDGIKTYYEVYCVLAGGSYDVDIMENKNKNTYHMNWGWGGKSDGWYTLSNFNYTYGLLTLSNIKPIR